MGEPVVKGPGSGIVGRVVDVESISNGADVDVDDAHVVSVADGNCGSVTVPGSEVNGDPAISSCLTHASFAWRRELVRTS